MKKNLKKPKNIQNQNSPKTDFEMNHNAYQNLLEEMRVEKKKLEDQRKATINILEDIHEVRTELDARYKDLETLKDLVQELGKNLKTSFVLQKLVDALGQTLPKPIIFSYAIPSSDPGTRAKNLFIHAGQPVSREYLIAIKEDFINAFKQIDVKVKQKENLLKWIKGKFTFEMVEGVVDKKLNLRPISSFCIPIYVGGEMLGMVNISSPKPSQFSDKDIELANTMVGATANSISRLRKLMESEEAKIESLVEDMSNGIIMFDLNNRVTLVNPAAQKMTGLTSKGFDLTKFTKLFKVNKIKLEDEIYKVIDSGQNSLTQEIIIARRIYEVYITPIRDSKKHIIGGAIILYDVTHIKEIDKMKTEFVSLASHQLRTPLTAIKLFTEILAKDVNKSLDAKQKEYINNVYQSTQRMIRLVNGLLNVSRIETGRLKIMPEITNMLEFIDGIIKEANPMAKSKNCRILFNKPKKILPNIPIDVTLTGQALHNLITNAIRYSPTGHCDIVITLTHKGKINSKNRTDGDIVISVLDEGVGIPKQVQKRIFEKFFRADNAIKMDTDGSGLGMYVAKMLIEAAGGKIWFESPPKGKSKGTVFYMSIPTKGMIKKEAEKEIAW